MLAFLIPVKHPANSRSYSRVTDLLRLTLTSIERQSKRPIGVHVVCNEVPEWAHGFPDVDFIEVDFPPARPPTDSADIYQWIYRDKGCKIAIALDRARRNGATHTMVADADDFVSCRLAEHVAANPGIPGWYFPTGIRYSSLFKIFDIQHEFWTYCGTSHIVRTELLPHTPRFDIRPTQEDIVSCFDPDILNHVLGDHVSWRHHFSTLGHPLEPLPFHGAVWHTDTGDNSSRAWFGQRRFGPVWGKPVGPEQAVEFGLPLEKRPIRASALLYGWRLRSLVRRISNRTMQQQ